MSNRLLIRRLTAELLGALQAKGYPLGPGKLMQVEALLQQLPQDTAPEALRTLLAPLLTSNAEEQRSFYELFDKVWAEFGEKEKGTDVPASSPLPDSETRWRRYLLAALLVLAAVAGAVFDPQTWISWVLAALAGAVAAVAGWKLPQHRAARLRYILAIPLLMAAGFGGKILLERWLERDRPLPVTTRIERFAIEQGQSASRPLHAPGDTSRLISAATCSGDLSGTTPAGNAYALDAAAGLLTFTADAEALPGSSDSVCVEAVFASRRDTLWFIADIQAAERVDTNQLTNQLAELPLPFPRSLSEIEVDPAAQARAEFYRRYQWPLKVLLFLLMGFAVWAFLLWDERRRAKFVAEIEQRDQPPYVWHIETGEASQPDFGDSLALLLNRLRRREMADIHRLDMPATVRASVRKAGRAVFKFKEQTRPPEYLLLIDRYDSNDHQARLFDALYQELHRAEVPAERFFYQGDPRVCFNETHPDGLPLSELLHRHRNARLLLIGEGQRLLMPSTGQLAPWTGIFSGWRRRALLLSKPTREWGRREQTLAGLFAISPASVQGIDLALEQFETLEQRSPAEALRRITDAVAEPFAFEGSLMSSLRRHFPEPLIQWIAACAVYPALHWDLTLYLGLTLSDAEGEPLISSGNVRQLTRLPWFLQGRIPENARLQLLDYLAAQGLETRVRRALDELLRRAPAPAQGSVAWDDYRMNVILNELLLNPDAARRRELEAEFERFLAAGKQPDFVAFKQLQRQPTRLDLLVPDTWKKYLFRHDSSRFGFRYYAKLLPALLLLGAGIAFAPLKTRVCQGESVSYEQRALCLETPADRLLYLEFLTRDAIEAQDHARADSLRAEVGRVFREAFSSRTPSFITKQGTHGVNYVRKVDTTAYYRNTAVYYYNYAARAYNCSKSPGSGCPALPTDSLLALACDNFRRGEARFAAVAGEQSIEFFSARQLACPESATAADTATFTLRGQVLNADDGQPIAGAQIQATAGAASYRASTGPDGNYALERVRPAAQLLVKVTAGGYDPASLSLPVRTELPVIRLEVSAAVREASAWQRALAADTPEAFSEYLREFPNGPNAAEARRRLDGFASAREKADWEDAQRANTIEAYAAHKRKYPGGAYTGEADTRMAALQEQADYDAALGLNTIAGYEGFLQKHVSGPNAADARSRLNSLRAVQDEDRAWQTALAANTPQAFQTYLDAWPNGRYVEEARKRINADGGRVPRPTMVSIPGGTFRMGDVMGDKEQDDETVHTVTVSGFQLGAYEVTFEEYDAFCTAIGRSKPDDEGWGRGRRPVINVSWEDVVAYCNWLSAQHGFQPVYTLSGSKVTANWNANGYRLPTEAEWEYAAREGGRKVRFGNGKDIADPKEINFDGSADYKKPYSVVGEYRGRAVTVGSFRPNALGLYDMSGNVWEWCWDWYDSYPAGAQNNPKGADTGTYRVFRGGGWVDYPRLCRASYRGTDPPSLRSYYLGFRLARS